MTKLVVTSCTDLAFSRKPATEVIRQIMDKWGYDYRPYVDSLWYGWPSKLEYLIRACHEMTDATHIMMIDAQDVVILCDPDELMERWAAFNHPWVYNAEPFIWSPNSFQPEDYPTPDVVFRYLNAGASISNREHMVKWFDKWTDFGKNKVVCKRGDQDWMAAHFISGYPDAIKLDINCDLFQCMCGSEVEEAPHVEVGPGHVHNLTTGTSPAVIHYNGGTDITEDKRRVLWTPLV